MLKFGRLPFLLHEGLKGGYSSGGKRSQNRKGKGNRAYDLFGIILNPVQDPDCGICQEYR